MSEKSKASAKGSQAAHPAQADQNLKFEEAFERLSDVVQEMERGELPLEELLQRFEEGVGLVKHCRGFLRQAQLHVEQFVEYRDGQWVLKDLE